MALKIIDHGSSDYQKMVDLRFALLRKPLGLTFTPEDLEGEKNDILIGVFEDEKLEGCCVLTEKDRKTIRLRQMAVTANLQGKGIGRALMSFAENIARDRGYRRLTMHARKTAVGFYEKNGYKVSSGEFSEVTIPHFEMEKEL
ncbi:GNAT family N-acetyltransferase [Sediminibacterium soli]|uniref:GNAT family N-acetyltransferase n=1 Tax=Sediminibacterium soli TaxID=2698829 RepID=UPI00137AE6B0|nr:GNAT family N-acetyltransferase [Sediminibacterium soli]NCI47352.1 GNAT family N-acetyltransferase [Sediminibacterium soli]